MCLLRRAVVFLSGGGLLTVSGELKERRILLGECGRGDDVNSEGRTKGGVV